MGAIRGNVDYDAGDVIDISDLVYLVDFMFNLGPAPPCFEEGDIDGSDEAPLDISDLSTWSTTCSSVVLSPQHVCSWLCCGEPQCGVGS
jgi:hypothetical protein